MGKKIIEETPVKSFLETPLAGEIADIIRREGPIPFSRYMDICLYHPEHGYYSSKRIGIGAGGDFMTSAQATPLFGALMAVQSCEFFERMGDPPYNLVEFGPGTGAMALSFMNYLSDHEKDIFSALIYHLVEPIESRHDELKKALEGFLEKISFSHSYPAGAERAVVLANEVIDAFPVHIVHKKDGELFELFVDAAFEREGSGSARLNELLVPIKEALRIHDKDEAEELERYIDEHLSEIPDDYRTEINLGMRPWLLDIYEALSDGFLVIIDYGFSRSEYLNPARNRGTMMGYHRHRVTEDFFSMPGLVDMTAHVNFSDLKNWADEIGFSVVGYAPQWAFLGGLDFDKTVMQVMGRIDPFSPELAGIKALIFPQAMGESHKVMVLKKGNDEGFTPKGFSMRNDLDRL